MSSPDFKVKVPKPEAGMYNKQVQSWHKFLTKDEHVWLVFQAPFYSFSLNALYMYVIKNQFTLLDYMDMCHMKNQMLVSKHLPREKHRSVK